MHCQKKTLEKYIQSSINVCNNYVYIMMYHACSQALQHIQQIHTNPKQTGFFWENTIHSYQPKPTKPTAVKKKIHPTPPRPGRAELRYNTSKEARYWFVLIELGMIHLVTLLVKQYPHDPKRTPYLKGPGPWKYVPAAAKQRGCLPISLYLLLSITQIHAWSLMKTCWTNMCKG